MRKEKTPFQMPVSSRRCVSEASSHAQHTAAVMTAKTLTGTALGFDSCPEEIGDPPNMVSKSSSALFGLGGTHDAALKNAVSLLRGIVQCPLGTTGAPGKARQSCTEPAGFMSSGRMGSGMPAS
mmetsp:Transcript_25570/g.52486  ORF Transcript_25570/g.52486 Transcript_25570/m.52486 type:complete len:124 (-) Transcript_25570:1460-1831(-)